MKPLRQEDYQALAEENRQLRERIEQMEAHERARQALTTRRYSTRERFMIVTFFLQLVTLSAAVGMWLVR